MKNRDECCHFGRNILDDLEIKILGMPTLSIVVPCHNEAKNIPILLEHFLKVHTEHPFELIVVNNASKDKSLSVLQEYVRRPEFSFLKVIDDPVSGYGRAIVTGLRQATGDILSWTHADLQTDPSDVFRGFNLFASHFFSDDVVIKGKRVARTFGSWFFTLGMSLIASMILRIALYDINAQPKMFTRNFFSKHCKEPPEDFSLDLYLFVIAKKNHCRVFTFPVSFEKRLYGVSTWAFNWRSRWKTTARTITYIFKLKKKM